MDSSDSDGICSLIETENKRNATGGIVGNISISLYDVNDKERKKVIHKENSHYSCVWTLCTLSVNRLVSGSYDHSIRIWKLSIFNITLLKEIRKYTNFIYKVIPLTKDCFASCSRDGTVKI